MKSISGKIVRFVCPVKEDGYFSVQIEGQKHFVAGHFKGAKAPEVGDVIKTRALLVEGKGGGKRWDAKAAGQKIEVVKTQAGKSKAKPKAATAAEEEEDDETVVDVVDSPAPVPEISPPAAEDDDAEEDVTPSPPTKRARMSPKSKFSEVEARRNAVIESIRARRVALLRAAPDVLKAFTDLVTLKFVEDAQAERVDAARDVFNSVLDKATKQYSALKCEQASLPGLTGAVLDASKGVSDSSAKAARAKAIDEKMSALQKERAALDCADW